MAIPHGMRNAVKREIVRAMLAQTQSMDRVKMTEMQRSRTPAVYDDVEDYLNIPYINSRDEVPLSMDFFSPLFPEDSEPKALPVIILLHGDGLMKGDRGTARDYCRRLAHLKYLVLSLEYRLAPRASVGEALNDVCAGLEQAEALLDDYEVDYSRVFLAADSEGAYLAAYVSAMAGSFQLQKEIGQKPTNLQFAALGLMNGIFYSDRKEPTGRMLAEQICGDGTKNKALRRCMDPERTEIIRNLPPAYLITCRSDVMNNDTFRFHDALKKAGNATRLLYRSDEDLLPGFVIEDPEHPKSVEATEKMLTWFDEQIALRKKQRRKDPAVTRRRNRMEKRIKDGSINDQKVWAYIKERSGAEQDRMEKTAIIDCTREYTYAQMFEAWDKYASAFTALGMTSENQSRVALAGAITAEPLFAFYALNMTGAEVSMYSCTDFMPGGSWRTMLEQERITDLILSDIIVTKPFLAELEKARRELGIRNVILLHSKMGGPALGPAELLYNEINFHGLERTRGTVFMHELLEKYADTPAFIDKSGGDTLAVIAHTSGTTQGTKKSLPYTNRAMNAVVTGSENAFRVNDEARAAQQQLRTLIQVDYSSFLSMGGLVNANLATGETIILTFFGFMHPKFIRAADYYNVDALVLSGFMIDKWLDRSDLDDLDLSAVKVVGLGGSYVTPAKMEKYKAFFEKHGCDCTICCGYGVPEAGGTQLMVSGDDAEDIIAKGEDCDAVRIQDETDGQFYRVSDGARTGTLYLTSDSMCSNTLDGEVLFDYTEIDGVNYICTNDLVRVNDDGTLSYSGRADQCFANSEGKTFDSGRVDWQMSLHPSIDKCAVVPVSDEQTQDTVPVLYVVPESKEGDIAERIRQAFIDVYVTEQRMGADELPAQFVIVDDIPLSADGKPDRFQITRDRLQGKAYSIIPVMEEEELTDIRIEDVEQVSSMTAEDNGDGAAMNIFNVFHTIPARTGETARRSNAPFPVLFPFPMQLPFAYKRENSDGEKWLRTVMERVVKHGNKFTAKLYAARDYDIDFED